MKFRRQRSVVAVLIAGILAAGAAVILRRGEVCSSDFTYVQGDAIKTLDPAAMSWMDEIRMSLGLWEGLTTYEPETLKPQGGAAYFPPQLSEDGKHYVFQLRPEARWSNGDAVTAADFIYGWRRAIEPGTAADYAFFLTETIAGAQAYAAWRHEAVKILGLLKDLARGKTVSQDDYCLIQEKLGTDAAGGAERNWEQAATDFRAEHLAQMEERFSQIGFRAVGDRELHVDLVRPVAYFLDLTSFSVMLPVHRSLETLRLHDADIDEATLWVYDPQWVKPDYHAKGYPGLITNGPFYLKAWKFKEYMLFEKNPYYWDRGAVVSERIMAKVISEANTAFLAYEQGEVDWLNDLTRLDFSPALLEAVRRGERRDIYCAPAFGTYFYNFNCKERLEDGRVNPLADWRLRKALTLAVDREAIVSQVKKQGNRAAYNLIPPESIAGYYCRPGPGYDPEAARVLLAASGYPGGENLSSIELLYNTGQGHEVTAQAVAEMWRQNLGIDVRLQGKELKTFAEDKKQQRYMICRASWFGDYGDPTTFLDMHVTGNGNNDSAFSDPRYDALMAQAADTLDTEVRMTLLAQAEALLNEEGFPILPLYYYVNMNAFRDKVTGLHLNARNMYFLKYLGKR